jgi:hypothetical protein
LAWAGVDKGFIGGRQETKESRGASGMGNKGLGVCGAVAVGVGVEGQTGVVWCETEEEAVRERSKTTKVVKGGREEEHIMVN